MNVNISLLPIELKNMKVRGSCFQDVVSNYRVVGVGVDDPDALKKIWEDRLIEFESCHDIERENVAKSVIALCHDSVSRDLTLYLCSTVELSVLFHNKKKIGVAI